MSEPAIDYTIFPSLLAPIEVLALRAWARALLWAEQEIQSIPEAIDPLQAFAVECGLVGEIGQDAVQKILSDAFAPYRDSEPRPSPNTGDEWDDPQRRPTPQTAIEAIMWCVRERGLSALREPTNKERLARCDQAAKAQINIRIEAVLKKGTPS